ncbi:MULTISPECIES: HNH endonuclease domain-containing protein [Pseudomonas]|uniref:HNH endonuclease n=1 Tax=Pseudomonas TaxID=286 RepID=UPI001573F5D4|nr:MULTISPECIES: HNH endonuclease domain-containing protein [Pseudomonas]MBG6125551.1 5-methylcytosine-specific restriction endonuclease McrA [Pseudomonas sp. M2]NSX23239.1 hypothetical protein [Pseudomonas putida]HDS1747800.1 hypothetical protein [Pseudomonas putida]
MFEIIDFSENDDALLEAVRSHKGKAWSAKDEVIAYRKRLLDLQNYRCAYCQGVIDLDEVGHRELDHILPKSTTKDCTVDKGRSNDDKHRQHTFGYPQFTFEPLNLIVTCKICNAFKKSHDPLLDRSLAYDNDDYPPPGSILWFYPYSHRYSDHISRTENWTYKRLSHQGEAVIRVCKLDKAEVLASRFAIRALIQAKRSKNARTAFTSLAAHVHDEVCSIEQAVDALAGTLDIGEEICEQLIKLWISYLSGGGVRHVEKFESVLAAILFDESLCIDEAAEPFARAAEEQTT